MNSIGRQETGDLSAKPIQQETERTKLIYELKTLILQNKELPSICPDWIPKAIVQKYLDYQDTQISTLILNKDLVSTKIGRRIFISRKSLITLLEKNIQK